MLVYNDRWYCPHYKICKIGKKCDRALTERIYEHAKQTGYPIDTHISKPECLVEVSV